MWLNLSSMNNKETKFTSMGLYTSKKNLSGGGTGSSLAGGGGSGGRAGGVEDSSGEQSAVGIISREEFDDVKKNIEVLDGLQEETRKVLERAKDINSFTTYFLFILVVAFIIAFYQSVSDYKYHLDEQRRYFFEILKDYQTKENSQEYINNFKTCLRTYNLNICTKSIK